MAGKKILIYACLVIAAFIISYGGFVEPDMVEVHHVWLTENSFGNVCIPRNPDGNSIGIGITIP